MAGESSLNFPDLSSQRGQSSFPPVTKSLASDGAVTIKFTMDSGRDQMCSYKLVAPKGSQMAIIFLDIDM